ncbi:C1 family peptidase [Chondromyces apiculatus]|uniref:Cysteine protease, papain family n=1 Tax=Chondromyces apiculatus DSM 436 TaxID=1192034 RepID=A0A017TGE1_9BACT|nr:C1 family peptidase [Chondromyces apiculatus]EYF07651.1 cysteine protease, papain family [Chondromyces apiculatus DSM 436]
MSAAVTKVGGWLREDPDPRDRSLVVAETSLLQRSGWNGVSQGRHVIPEYTPLSNQGALSACVANSWCDAMEILRGLEKPEGVIQLSRLFVYWNARRLHEATGKDAGTFIRAGAQQLRKLGICEEQFWPYDAAQVLKAPPTSCYPMAAENRLTGFYRITGEGPERLRQIELAIRANHPVIFGTMIGTGFQAYAGGGHVQFIPPKDEWVGAHAMVLTGVDVGYGRRFLVRNSWGSTWGDDGHAWLDDSYLAWDQTQDVWVGTRMPGLV